MPGSARTMGAATVAACALLALSAAGAFALPEIGRCLAAPGSGRYKNSACTEKAGTKAEEKRFEWAKGAVAGGKGFTAIAGPATFDNEPSCASVTASGEYSEVLGAIRGVKDVVLRFRECMLTFPDATCRTPGAAEGEIVTSALKGKLGYVSGAKTRTPVVGLELTPPSRKTPFTSIECGAGSARWLVGEGPGKGGNRIIGTLGEANVMSASFANAFAATEGKQEPQSFEGTFKLANLEWQLNGNAWESLGLSFASTITNEQELEIKA